jgi:hypothetical protein
MDLILRTLIITRLQPPSRKTEPHDSGRVHDVVGAILAVEAPIDACLFLGSSCQLMLDILEQRGCDLHQQLPIWRTDFHADVVTALNSKERLDYAADSANRAPDS